MCPVAAEVRLILVTGGPAAGKTRLCQRLYGELPKNWRLVPLDNFIELALKNPVPGQDWPDRTVQFAEVCLDYWRKERVFNLLVEGVIQNSDQVTCLCRAFGVSWPLHEVRLIQLLRSFESHRRRRNSSDDWSPPLGGTTREQALRNLETRVPQPILGAKTIVTDTLSEDQVQVETLAYLQ